MNKRGNFDNQLAWTFAYLIIFLIFFAGMYYFVASKQQNAAFWEDYHAKQIALILDNAHSGQEFSIEVSSATRIAASNGKSPNEIFVFDNRNHEVVVSLRDGSATRFSYFRDLVVLEPEVELISGGAISDRLRFKVQ